MSGPVVFDAAPLPSCEDDCLASTCETEGLDADTNLLSFLLIGSSITMGAVAIWCMHFIGNRAIVLGNGQAQLQIAYSSTFTALSFFVPIIVLLAAFLAVGTNDRVGKVRVAFGGTLAGLAICGMHYVGQAGIANYTSVYQVVNIAGAALVAVVASVTALTIFFVLRAAWTNSWWKRGLCAIILAGGVSGMHWIASVGTQYRYKRLNSPARLSRNQTVIVVIVLVSRIPFQLASGHIADREDFSLVARSLCDPLDVDNRCSTAAFAFSESSQAGRFGLCYLRPGRSVAGNT